MHGVSKELILRMDSLHQIEMSKISTESGSSYKKGEKNDIRPISAVSHLTLARQGIHPLSDFSKQIQFKATKVQLRV